LKPSSSFISFAPLHDDRVFVTRVRRDPSHWFLDGPDDGHRVIWLGSSTSDCTEPNLAQKLAEPGYTHLLVRRDTADGLWFAEQV
jgi:hypothetical protein